MLSRLQTCVRTIGLVNNFTKQSKLHHKITKYNFNHYRNITYYTKDHEFINYKKEENTAEIGITFYAKDSLGEIIFIDNEFECGDEVDVGDEIITLESTKATGCVSSPVTGEIEELNNDFIEDLDEYNKLSKDDETQYWLAQIKLSNEIDTTELLTKEEYEDLVTKLNNT